MTDKQSSESSASRTEEFYGRLKRIDIERAAYAEGDKVQKFFSVAVEDIVHFFSRIFGESYTPQNNFSFGLKQKILAYLYQKNDFDIEESRKKPFSNLGVNPLQAGDKAAIKLRIEYLDDVERFNRIFLISSMAESQRRLRYAGFAWGALWASLASAVLLRKSNHVRKAAAAAFCFHFTAQYISYVSIDKVFDPLYPFFKSDLEKYLKEEKEREQFMKDSGNLKIYDDITLMMREDLHKTSTRIKNFEDLERKA